MPRLLMVLLAALALTACADAEPFEPRPIDEIPDGPGLVSGDDGEFTVFRGEL